MTIITIPKELAKKGDLVLVPKSEYREFLNFRKLIKTAKSTKSEKKAIARGRREIKSGQYLPWSGFKNELARLYR
jgi:hypothetical protein